MTPDDGFRVLSVPPRQRADLEVDRPRLWGQIDTARPVVVVVAAPGHGATTAVAQWARVTRTPVHWVVPGTTAVATETLRRRLTELLDQVPRTAPGAAPLSREQPPALVLDGLDRIDPGAATDKRLRQMIEQESERRRVIITTHTEVGLPLLSWSASRLATVIDEDALALDEREAIEVARSLAPALDPAEVIHLNDAVEGWPLALLASLDVADAAVPEQRGRSLDTPPRALDDHVMSWLRDRLSADDRDAAMRLAVAEVLDGEACQRLLGCPGADLVERLRAERLLRPAAPTSSLRFHPTVRKVLLDRLGWFDPDLLAQLHRDLADHFTQRGELVTARRHLVAAGEQDAATQLVVARTLASYDAADRRGAVARLGRLTQPEQTNDGEIALEIAMSWMFAGSLEQAWSWCRRAESLSSIDNHRLVTLVHATHVVLSMVSADLDNALTHLEALEQIEPRPLVGPPIDGILITSAARLGLALGDHEHADEWLNRSRSTVPNPVFDLIVSSLQAAVTMQRGALRPSRQRMSEVTATFASRGMWPHLGHFEASVVEAWAHVECGDLAAAATAADAIAAHADELGFPWCRLRAVCLGVTVQFISGGPRNVLPLIAEHRQWVDTIAPGLRVPFDVAEARARLLLGDVEGAGHVIAQLPAGAARMLMTAEALIATGRAGDVASLLTVSKDWSFADQLTGRSLLAVAVGGDEGSRLLADVVEDAARLGWVTPLLRRIPLVEQRLVSLPLDRLHPKLLKSIRAFTGHRPMTDPFTDRERSILELLASHLTYAEIGKHLHVSVNTVKSNMRSIYHKLAVNRRSDAVAAAAERGLL